MRNALSLFKRAAQGWLRDRSPRIAAALSYYAVVSLAPLIIVAVAVLSLVFEDAEARRQVVSQAEVLAGPQVAEVVAGVVEALGDSTGDLSATLIGIVAALIGALGGFVQLQDALNTVWNVPRRDGGGVLSAVVARLPAFLMLVIVTLLLLAAAFATTLLGSLRILPGPDVVPPLLFEAGNLLLTVIVLTAAFAVLYRVLPEADIPWRDVWVGAAVTALLFVLGRAALGLYLTRSVVASAYGAASALAVLLVWVYYTAQVVLYGAEFTQVWACTYGSRKHTGICGVQPEGGPGAPPDAQAHREGRLGRETRGGANVTS